MRIVQNNSGLAFHANAILGDPGAVSRVAGIFVGESYCKNGTVLTVLTTNCPWVSEDVLTQTTQFYCESSKVRINMVTWSFLPFAVCRKINSKLSNVKALYNLPVKDRRNPPPPPPPPPHHSRLFSSSTRPFWAAQHVCKFAKSVSTVLSSTVVNPP